MNTEKSMLRAPAGELAAIAMLAAVFALAAASNADPARSGAPMEANAAPEIRAAMQPDQEVQAERKSPRFGKLVMKHACPAANPGYQPAVLWGPSSLGAYTPPAIDVRENQEVDLLLGILSSCQTPQRRTASRESWMKLNSTGWGTWRAVFIVGPCVEELAEEQRRHGDLLFTDVPESYHNISSKVLAFFDYARSNGRARFVMKTDDDTFVFVDRLLRELQRMEPECLYWGSEPHHLPKSQRAYDRSDLSIPTIKWFIHPKDIHHFFDVTYMQGGGYILSSDLIKQITESPQRMADPAAGFCEDANIGRLLSKESFADCQCGDSRIVHSVQSFQGKTLFTDDGSPSDFRPCGVSDVAHRTIALHGIHHAPDMADLLRLAVSEAEPCTHGPIKGRPKRPWMMLNDADQYRIMRTGRLWRFGKLMKGQPLELRPLPLRLAMANLLNNTLGNQTLPRLDSTLFNKVRGIMKAADERHNGGMPQLLPSSDEWSRFSDLIRTGSWPFPWCTRLKWATQAAEEFARLESLGILACDLSADSLFVNISSLELELSAGQAWLPALAGQARFHTIECPHGDAQCEACFLHLEEPMDWLPEARCSPETRRCPGFDLFSQAKVAVHRVLRPLLSEAPLGHEGLEREVSNILSSVSDAPFPLPPEAEAAMDPMARVAAQLQSLLSDHAAAAETCHAAASEAIRTEAAANNFRQACFKQRREPVPNWVTSGPFHRIQVNITGDAYARAERRGAGSGQGSPKHLPGYQHLGPLMSHRKSRGRRGQGRTLPGAAAREEI